MSPELETARRSQIVIASVVAAAVAVTLFCLVGIAAMLGWVGPRNREDPAVSAVALAQKAARAAPGVALVPGETLVSPAEPGPGAAPVPPPAADPAAAKPDEPKPARAPRKPATRSDTARPQKPATPNYARADPTDSSDSRPRKLVCRTCGTVTAIATFPDLWEVRVRLEDGASFNVRYPSPPDLRVGDRVRLANGRLERQ